MLLADPSLPGGHGCETKSQYKLPHWSLPHALPLCSTVCAHVCHWCVNAERSEIGNCFVHFFLQLLSSFVILTPLKWHLHLLLFLLSVRKHLWRVSCIKALFFYEQHFIFELQQIELSRFKRQTFSLTLKPPSSRSCVTALLIQTSIIITQCLACTIDPVYW